MTSDGGGQGSTGDKPRADRWQLTHSWVGEVSYIHILTQSWVGQVSMYILMV